MRIVRLARTVLSAALCVAASTTASAQLYVTSLSGPAEVPPNASPGVGEAWVFLNHANDTMKVHIEFSGLLGNVTVSHIHAPTAVAFTGTAGAATQVPTLPGFPSGVTGGTYHAKFDMTLASSYNPSFYNASGGTATLARHRLWNAILDGKAYWNVHSNLYPAGEIRGFFVRAVPEPGSMAMLGGLALSALWFLRRSAKS